MTPREPFKHEWYFVWSGGLATGAFAATDYQWRPAVGMLVVGLTLWLIEWAWWRLSLSARIAAAWQGFTCSN